MQDAALPTGMSLKELFSKYLRGTQQMDRLLADEELNRQKVLCLSFWSKVTETLEMINELVMFPVSTVKEKITWRLKNKSSRTDSREDDFVWMTIDQEKSRPEIGVSNYAFVLKCVDCFENLMTEGQKSGGEARCS